MVLAILSPSKLAGLDKIEKTISKAGKGIQKLYHKANSGAFLTTEPNKTTPILGTYMDDTQYILIKLKLKKSIDFGAKKG